MCAFVIYTFRQALLMWLNEGRWELPTCSASGCGQISVANCESDKELAGSKKDWKSLGQLCNYELLLKDCCMGVVTVCFYWDNELCYCVDGGVVLCVYKVCNTDIRRVRARLRAEKCVVRRFRRRANVIECTYTNLDSITYYRYASLNDGGTFWEMRR